jgi:hypothetical protein
VTHLPSTNGRRTVVEDPPIVFPAIAVQRVPVKRASPQVPDPSPEPWRRAAEAIIRRDAAAAYGGLLVTALIAIQWRSATPPDFMALTVIVSLLVFWLTHVWAQTAERRLDGPTSRADLVRIARHEASMLVAGVPPVLALGLARLSVVTADQAISLALVVCFVQLFLLGLAIGQALHQGWPTALGVAAIECGLGGLLVGLKVVVVH